MKTGLLSIHERYADAILNGTKQYEYRRKAPQLAGPTRFLIYATTPRRALVGEMVVDAIVKGSPEKVWRQTHAYGGIERDAFFDYFDGADEANALHIASHQTYAKPLSLEELRRRSPGGFTPPQYLAWLTTPRLTALRAN